MRKIEGEWFLQRSQILNFEEKIISKKLYYISDSGKRVHL